MKNPIDAFILDSLTKHQLQPSPEAPKSALLRRLSLDLAGDLLPNATLDQRIASAFNRNHLLNGEGGAIPEEQRNVILVDRVDVTTTTWLGLTMACAQCHDHKYDPIPQRDFYRMMAFFNQVPETADS